MDTRRIDSPKNPRVKELVRLRERRERERSDSFLIEGERELERALQAGVELRELFLAPQLARPQARRLAGEFAARAVRVTELSEAAFAKASLRDRPDGLLGIARRKHLDAADLQLPPAPLLLVADGLEKPGNLGALLRTADAAAVDAVLVSGRGTDLYNPNVVRASMGSLFSRPLLALDAPELLGFLRAAGVRLVATSPAASKAYWDADLRGPLAVVVGAEHRGLEAHWLEAAEERLRIPMSGLADSLNVATAGALLLYEALRQRRTDPPGAP